VQYIRGVSTKEDLLEAALTLFSTLGIEATSTQAVCDAAGVTKPTLYHYFGSKSGLIDAVLERHFQPFIETLSLAVDYQHDLTRNLERVMQTYFNFARTNPVFYRLQLAMRSAPAKSETFLAIKPWQKAQTERIETLFIAAEADHGNMRGRARTYTLSLFGVINAYILESMEAGNPTSDQTAFQAKHQFMHGIFS
jgi:AcrR family transcriptional regulator